jgi:hypothetical protein
MQRVIELEAEVADFERQACAASHLSKSSKCYSSAKTFLDFGSTNHFGLRPQANAAFVDP